MEGAPKNRPDPDEFFMADGLMLELFMAYITVEIAKTKPSPEQWARQFLSNLTGEVDSSEIRQGHDNYSTMELARQGFDRLATRVLSRLSDGGSP